ncbi:aminoglycoside phosphotransferase [Paenibacillus sp. 1011MAR3C5]|uniref:phosphotransferase family protein n=1 Tax=Paenibacillus sp. 1011MAR3C5 TaxID=1675787 RepID=UPI000E6D175C|nr:phosphotransferase [Paenibacillus sp. 1011MAR3C5]RJE87046.1 aminoglycoside phosphotransferase [Paenibacillus sp. 1011MAR3C5]
MTVLLGQKLAEGGCAEVFEWGEGKIVKLAKPNTNEWALRRELNHSRIAKSCGLPVPDAYELIHTDGRPGIVFEHIKGESLMKRFVDRAASALQAFSGTRDDLGAALTANLLFQVHQQSAEGLPRQRESLEYDIRSTAYLTEKEHDAVIDHMNRLPEKEQLCHGDPNPGNILLREHDAFLIDWNNASIGNPEADLAEYILMIRYTILPSHLPELFNQVLDAKRESTILSFVAEYKGLSGIGHAEIVPWLPVIAARKLCADAISEEENRFLIQEVRSFNL